VTISIFTTNDAVGSPPSATSGPYIFGANAVFALLLQARTTQSFRVVPVPSGDASTRCNASALVAAIKRGENLRVVVITDTGTMLNTCHELEVIAGKTVIVTGAWKPGPYPDGDAALNLGMAVAAAQILDPGIYVAMNGFVRPARAVRLNRDKDQFEEMSTTS
jgi:L-asparaginase